jgi:hypothetical protein
MFTNRHDQTDKYDQPATRLTPGLVIYLIDASDSMSEQCGQTTNGSPYTKIELVNQALEKCVNRMAMRCMRDEKVQPRYHLAMFAYSTKVIDVLNGIRTLPQVLRIGTPNLTAGGDATDTAAGFAKVEELLQQCLNEFKPCPAPLVCHFTDALRTTDDPSPFVKRIRAMRVDDGAVLVENVLMAEEILRKPVKDWHTWGGVRHARELTDEYAQQLFALSSPIPETYRHNINHSSGGGYQLQKGAALFFPGTHIELVELALAASFATQ